MAELAGAGAPDLPAWEPILAGMPWRQTPTAWWEPGPHHGTWFPGGRINAATALVTVQPYRDGPRPTSRDAQAREDGLNDGRVAS